MKRISSNGSSPRRRALAGAIAAAGVLMVASGISCRTERTVVSRYMETADALRRTGLADEKAYDLLRRITEVGPRLTGSAGAAAAVDLTRKMMEEMGFDNVHVEPVTVERWVRGEPEEAKLIDAGPPPAESSLAVAALGGSVGTPAEGAAGPVVEVRSFEELDRLGTAVKGKIVFFNRPMDRSRTEPFAAYGGAADQRVGGASRAGRLGAVAVLVRSLTFRIDGHPHTGLMEYAPDAPKIPAAAVSTDDAERLSALLRSGRPIAVRLKMSCRDLGPVPSANVVGDLRGAGKPDEIILVGGHLDSWDLAVGAHDDGAGCAASLEALRLIKALGLRPKRTIRAVMFMDEEFGGTGGRFYVQDPARRGERHLVAMESDRGGYLPLGLSGGGSDKSFLRRLEAWSALVKPLGVAFVGPGGGGVDIAPLVKQGAVPVSVVPDAQPYFDVHHSALDVLAAVHPRELEMQAIILATLAYLLAQEGT